MSTIPASAFVNVVPNVLGAGGSALVLNGMILTHSVRVPIGTVASFSSAAAVGTYFGLNSAEYFGAQVYFAGFDNSNQKPGTILFTQFPAAAVAAYLRGGNASAISLAQLQAMSGSLTVVVDGYTHVIGSINLSSATSFSSAAALIQAAFTDPVESSFTASIGSSVTGAISGTTLTVSAVSGGLVSVGDTVTGSGVTAGTKITALGSGTGGTGTYTVNNSQTVGSEALTTTSNVLDVTVDTDHTIAAGQTLTGSGVAAGTLITSQISGTTGGIGLYAISGAPQQVASEAMTGVATAPLVEFDSISQSFVVTSGITGTPSSIAFATGSLAAPLLLTSSAGAVLSQGAAVSTPSAFMTTLTQNNNNWASFMTAFDPDGGSGNSQKLLFAQWTDSVAPRYVYVCFDSDATAASQLPATGSLGYLLQQGNYSGTNLNWEPSDEELAWFVCGSIASIDFAQKDGRITFAYKSQTGLVAGVSTQTAAFNLGGDPQAEGDYGNGYNYYGAVATANQGFTFYQRGTISGPWKWLDSYVNQIQMSAAFQLAILTYMTTVNSIPYNTDGYTSIEAACSGVIQAALNFGSIRTGVPLSASQASEVNTAAGKNISNTLQNQGWYLQVLPASPTVRISRSSPPCMFWYTDGESIQSISLASINVQ